MDTENDNKVENENTPPVENEAGSVDTLSGILAESMPEVQDHVVQAAQEREEALQSETLTDVDGTVFDPEIHRHKKDGSPTVTKLGRFSLKPGKATGDSPRHKPKTGGFVGGTKPDSPKIEPEKIQAAASGKMAANLLMTLGVTIGGEEWNPVTNHEYGINEKDMLEQAFADYFIATGKTDLPPGMVLTVAIGGYVLPRFTMPKTQTRMQKAGSWIKEKYINWKLRKHGVKVKNVDNKGE